MISNNKIYRYTAVLQCLFPFVWMCTLALGVTGGIAQTSFVSSGISNTNQSLGSVSYSVGQVFYHTISNTSAKIEEGVQHAHEIYTVEVFNDVSFDPVLKAYPNPVEKYLILETKVVEHSKIRYRIDDVFGNTCLKGSLQNPGIKIDLSTLNPAIYLLEVFTDQSRIKTLIILKQ